MIQSSGISLCIVQTRILVHRKETDVIYTIDQLILVTSQDQLNLEVLFRPEAELRLLYDPQTD